jgi:undecaprenyl-diphosphatase
MDRRVPGAEDRLASDRRLIVPTRPTDRRSLLLLAVLTLMPFLALAVWARFLSPAPWEPGLVDTVALGPGLFGDVFRAINNLGELPPWSVLVGVVALGTWFVRGVPAALLVGLSLLSDVAAFAVKVLVERPRPDTVAAHLYFGPDSFSFPSGHVVRAVALFAALGWLLAPPGLRFRLALASGLVAGLVMGYARVSLGVHWPTDALGGARLGMGWFALTAWLVTARGRSV